MEKKRYEIAPLQQENASKIVKWNENGSQAYLEQWAGQAFNHPITAEQIIDNMKICNAVFEIHFDGQMIGTIACMFIDEKEESGHIGHFLLDPAFAGKGHGTAILREFAAYCLDTMKLKQLTLRVFTYNIGAIRCYQKNGFQLVESSKTEDGLEVWLMRLRKTQTEEVTVRRDGLVLRGRCDKQGETKSNAAILFHGFGCDIGADEDSAYQKISQELVNQKIAVFRFDFNGHGKSDGAFSNMNIWNEIEDAIAILEYVRAQQWVEQIYIIGHSQGGVIAGMLAGYYADVVRKLVLLAPGVSLKSDAQKGICMQATYDTNHIPLSVNVDGCHEVGGHYFRIAKSLPIFEVTSQFENPALLIVGLNDDVISAQEAKEYSQCMKNCEFVAWDGFNHGLNGEDQYKAISKITQFLTQ